jgi:biopolymer transport protein ExbD
MNITRRRRKKSFNIPLNSMSDVAFLLLIFIMLVSLINYRREVKIEYPEAGQTSKTSVEHNLEIWVDRDGALYINGERDDLQTIQNSIVDAYQSAPDTRVHIIADRNTPYEHISRVLELLQILQYQQVSLVVKDIGI